MTRQTSKDAYKAREDSKQKEKDQLEVYLALLNLAYLKPLTAGEIRVYGNVGQVRNDIASRLAELRDNLGWVVECGKRLCEVSNAKTPKPVLTWKAVTRDEWVPPKPKKKRPNKKQRISALTEINSLIMRYQVNIGDDLRLFLDSEWDKVK